MNEASSTTRPPERWAHFRFSVIGPLLAAPPAKGQLQAQLQELATQKWRHPISKEWVVLGRSTIERWYYQALRSKTGPVEALQRKTRSDHGHHPSVSAQLVELLTQQHRQHPVGVTNSISTTWRWWWNNTPKPAPCPATPRCCAI